MICGHNLLCGHFSLNPRAKIFIPRGLTRIRNTVLNVNAIPYSPGETINTTVVALSLPDACPYTLNYSTIRKQKFILNPSAETFVMEYRRSKTSKCEVRNNFTHPEISVLNPEAKIFTPYPSQTDNHNELSMLNDTPSVHDILTPILSEPRSFSEMSTTDELTIIATNNVLDFSLPVQSPGVCDVSTPRLTPAPRSCMCTSSLTSTCNIELLPHIIPDIGVDLPPKAVKRCTDKHLAEASFLDSSMIISNMDGSKHADSLNEDISPYNVLKNIRVSNINRLVIGHLNINSLRNKFEALKSIVSGNLDILVITESKLDESFPVGQFLMQGYSPPFRLDRFVNGGDGGGVLIYVRNDIACTELKTHFQVKQLEGIFLELNLKKSKWLVFGGYNPSKDNTADFVNGVGLIIDRYMSNYDNVLLLGDFNSEIQEKAMKEFCEMYNLSNLIKDPTCFKNPISPSLIDLILTNRPRNFQNSLTIETGLSDHHKLTITVMKGLFPKQSSVIISYRDYKHYNEDLFRNELLGKLYSIHCDSIDCNTFEHVCIEILNRHAPLKIKYIRANNSPFMNKILSKAVMTRSRLRNKFLKNPNNENRANYNKYRNYCTRLFRKEKRSYYNNLNTRLITDNKQFWKTIKPLFSEKHFSNNKITLLEGNEIISEDVEVAKKINKYFSNVVKNLNIEDFEIDYCYNSELDDISNIIEKFKNHPSVLKIKENVNVEAKFHFDDVSDTVIKDKINSLDKRKPTTFNNIPTRILVENCDIISPFITDIYNNSKTKSEFPATLKLADITPAHKKGERTIEDNYRPVSILSSISKVFERNMYDQINVYIDKHLSPCLFGFRKGFSTQHCLMVMLDKWLKAMDKGKLAGALLTDLSKAFDCLNHELLTAKLEAYGFDKESLAYIYSYLSDRKQRTKVNTSFSEWENISSGVPQGSILGPLLFNIYLNDIFYFVHKCDIANYADDTTAYTIDTSLDSLLQCLYKDTSVLIKWFKNNYLQMNPDKCKLLISNKNTDVSLTLENEVIECNSSVKLLGVTIDSRLSFHEHVCNLCKKANTKLHALARISNYMNQEKLRLLMKSFIESQFSYCPLIWMFHGRTLNNRINRLHERGLRLVYKNYALSFEELLRKDNSFTIHHRNLQKLATEMYKAHNDLSPSLVKSIFPKREIPYNLRNKNPFQVGNIRTVFNGTETISYRGPKIWGLVPNNIKNSKNLSEFKSKIRNWEPIGCTCRICKTFISGLGFI